MEMAASVCDVRLDGEVYCGPRFSPGEMNGVGVVLKEVTAGRKRKVIKNTLRRAGAIPFLVFRGAQLYPLLDVDNGVGDLKD